MSLWRGDQWVNPPRIGSFGPASIATEWAQMGTSDELGRCPATYRGNKKPRLSGPNFSYGEVSP